MTIDVVTMGRCSIDLYSNDVGAAFPDIKSFGAFVGGTPTNIAVGLRRLGTSTTLLGAVGDDPVGEFVLGFLRRERVDVASVAVKPGMRTPAVLLAIQPPDRFPLVFYRDRAPDVELSIDDVLRAPLAKARALVVTGTGLARDPGRAATLFALEVAREAGVMTVLDLDLRPDQWHDARAFGVAVRSALPLVDVAIGTEDEIKAAAASADLEVRVTGGQISAAEVSGNVERAMDVVLARGARTLVVKRGVHGSSVHRLGEPPITAGPFKVEVLNVLGAGDGFASGLVHGLLRGWGWHKSARMGNAVGAILVTKQGCADFMPSEKEALAFAESQGGL